jgi:hypothetical protein
MNRALGYYIFTAVILVSSNATLVSGQVKSVHRCTVGTQLASSKGDILSIQLDSIKTLGSFEAIPENDKSFSHVYAVPRTKLYVTAAVSYSKTLLGSENDPDFLNMRLLVVRHRRDNVSQALAFAEAEIPSTTISNNSRAEGSVTTTIKVRNGALILVTLTCGRSP